jgi:hypothetical protein
MAEKGQKMIGLGTIINSAAIIAGGLSRKRTKNDWSKCYGKRN